MPTRHDALLQVRACFDTEQSMADYFGVTQPTVWRWLNQHKQLPGEHVLAAERLGVSKHALRPDLYPHDMPPGPRWKGIDEGGQRVAFGTRRLLQGPKGPVGS